MTNGKTWTLASTAVGMVAALTAVWFTVDPWPSIGWVTPARHNADIANISTTIGVFRDEWRCMKYGEELDILYAKMSERETRRLRDQVIDQRKKMDETKCIRFREY